MMTFARLETTFWHDPKVYELMDMKRGDAGFQYCRMLSYCAQQLNDGLMSSHEVFQALGVTESQVKALIAVHLLDTVDGRSTGRSQGPSLGPSPDGSLTVAGPSPDGQPTVSGRYYRIHNFSKHERTREEVNGTLKHNRDKVRDYRNRQARTAQPVDVSHAPANYREDGYVTGYTKNVLPNVTAPIQNNTRQDKAIPSSFTLPQQKKITLDEWHLSEKEKERIYENYRLGHEDGDCTLAGMRKWWAENRPGAQLTSSQWLAEMRGWFSDPRSIRHAPRYAWLSPRVLQDCKLRLDQAGDGDNPRLLQCVAAALNKGMSDEEALKRAKQVISASNAKAEAKAKAEARAEAKAEAGKK